MTVTLLEPTPTGTDPFGAPVCTDPFGAPVCTEREVQVGDVLIAPASGTEIVNNTDLHGAAEVYTLAVPKGDAHQWEGARVRFWGREYRVIGPGMRGMDENIPLRWNAKYTVARWI